MKTKEILKKIQIIFEEKISEKNGWGKCEVIAIFKESMALAILEALEMSEK